MIGESPFAVFFLDRIMPRADSNPAGFFGVGGVEPEDRQPSLAKLAQRFEFDLPNALARDAQRFGDHVERRRTSKRLNEELTRDVALIRRLFVDKILGTPDPPMLGTRRRVAVYTKNAPRLITPSSVEHRAAYTARSKESTGHDFVRAR
jgi:hypothetical protein